MKGPLRVGIPTSIISESPAQPFAAVFEDDGETGFFYAMEIGQRQIVDAVHIYDVEAVEDREKESQIDIRWSGDGTKCLLLINRYPHAAFDFSLKCGYCRSDYPNFPQSGEWRTDSHRWIDAVLSHFQLGE